MSLNTISLDTFKLLLGITGSTYDTLLSAILALAESEFLSSTHRETVPTAAENIVLRMALARYNHVKDEGYTSVSFNGISQTFAGYDDDLLRAIQGFRKVVLL